MNRKVLAVLFILLLCLCAGCGTSVKSDLEDYIKFEQGADGEVKAAFNDFMAKANKVTDNKEEKLALLNEGMKNFSKITEKQKGYKPKTQEVQDIHNKALKQLDMTLGIFNDLIQGLQNDTLDQTTISEINKKQQEVQKLAQEYYDDIKKLKEKNK